MYEETFEPLTLQFAAAALARLAPLHGKSLIDVGAGAGGAAILAARECAKVTAIDAAKGMVLRINQRTRENGLSNLEAWPADAAQLAFPDATFDLGLSVLGIVLMPNAERGMAEMRRVLKLGSKVALVTWTQPHRYELAARLRAAIDKVRPQPLSQAPNQTGPAQLRYVEAANFRALIESAQFKVESIEVVEACLEAKDADWLGQRLAFAPGLAATISGLEQDKSAVIEAFVADLRQDYGTGPIALRAVAHVGLATAC
ncbi:MAG: methyltransferase domain-containing protein [Hyphomicrobiales bacterium]|nr:methyltransferase domain-containing protein [Hyphomicrobiales bacterium]MDE2114871.1 class I SAM-dependent methyltransferase [Hyphomicrobiales bacterium]